MSSLRLIALISVVSFCATCAAYVGIAFASWLLG